MNTQYRNKKQTQLEIEIEAARTHKDWATVWNLFKKYSKVNPDSLLEALAHAEHALDNYDVSQARTCLDKAKAADPENEEVFALYGRLEFVAKDIEKSYGYLSLIHMPPNDQFLFPRTLRLLLQSWQLKGLCQEARHEYKQAANTYKELLDLAVRSSNNLTTLDVLAKPFVETALCNLPLLQFDDVFSSIQLSRQALFVPFELSPNSLHSTLRHLAHLLLRDTCAASYPQLQEDPGSSALRYTPRTANEEALLALLKSSHDNPSPIDLYEDISLAYSRLNLYSPIVDAYERLLSFQIGDVHQLMQLALALMSSGRYRRALYVMQDCVTRDPTNPIFLLLTVKICVNHLRMPVLGLEYADKAENCLEDKPENWVWLARARMAVGICYGKLGLEAKTFEERKVYQKRALHYLLLARQLDPNDASIAFNLALVYADIRDITRALKYVRRSLTLDRTNSNSWGLLSLLLSSQKRFTVAHSVLSQALAEDPTNICLTLIKAKLEQMLDEPVQALQTYRTAFGHYAIIREEQTPKQPEPKLGAGSVHSAESGRTAETRTTHRRTMTSADDNVSVALSQARSHVLSLHTNPRDGPDDEGVSTASDPALTNLWLATADAFTQAGQVSDAVDCLQEARALDDNNAALFYQEGCMLELQDQLQEALVQYHRCLSVDYNHVMARVRIAMISMKAKDFNLAEQLLSSLLRLEPTCHQAWFHLGCVLKERPGEEKRAAECFQRAVELDKTAPVMPFSTIARLIP